MKRTAIDPETGEKIKIPADMTYQQWYEKYVKGKSVVEAKEKAVKNQAADKRQFEKYKEIYPDEIPNTLEDFQNLKYNNIKEWEVLVEGKQHKLNSMEFSEMKNLVGKLGDKEVRSWYIEQDKKIPDLIDYSQTLEEQAKQACKLRNKNRTNARDLMKNQEARKKLDIDDPNKSFDELVLDKIERKNISREKAIEDIIKTATKTRRSVNEKYGLEG